MTDRFPIVTEPTWLDRQRLATPPPADGYVQDGWRCLYHPRGFCHNPLDCTLIPTWIAANAAADEIFRAAEPTRVTLAELARRAKVQRELDENGVLR